MFMQHFVSEIRPAGHFDHSDKHIPTELLGYNYSGKLAWKFRIIQFQYSRQTSYKWWICHFQVRLPKSGYAYPFLLIIVEMEQNPAVVACWFSCPSIHHLATMKWGGQPPFLTITDNHWISHRWSTTKPVIFLGIPMAVCSPLIAGERPRSFSMWVRASQHQTAVLI